MKKLLLFCLALGWGNLTAQPKQTLRGRVIDKDAKYALIGVSVLLTPEEGQSQGNATDQEGVFRFTDLPVGRYTIKLTLVGYRDLLLNNIILDAGKETILNLELSESVTQLDVVTIRRGRSGEASNEMAVASARQFSVEETGRYAGSRGEPARMASNFAGVQGADDSRNDIVIRGNSPNGLLWRIEGVSVPNPNHFAEAGSSGGPVSIINNKYLANSDFFTGAFPSEFANTISGVFDLKLRNGNSEKHEAGLQFGFLGTEFIAEGPLSKSSGSSYLVTGRYANLWLFKKLGIDIGTQATPTYMDGFARFNFPINGGKGGDLSLWALGGDSRIDILASEQKVSDRNIFGQNDRDQRYGSAMSVIGLTYNKSVGKSLYFKSTIAISGQVQDSRHDFLFLRKTGMGEPVVENERYRIDSIKPLMDFRFSENRYSWNTVVNKKWGGKSTLRAGINLDLLRFTGNDSIRVYNQQNVAWDSWQVRWATQDAVFLYIQPFVQFRRYLTENLSATVGATGFINTVNKESRSWFEPRAGLALDLPNRKKITLTGGLHSQSMASYLYFAHNNLKNRGSQSLTEGVKLMKSVHLVGGFSQQFAQNIRLLTEIYYQHLYDVPVYQRRSSFSVMNAVEGANRLLPEKMTNGGKGRNYGIEVTLEKYFSRSYFFLLTTSLFDAKYKGSDGVWRNTNVNGRYALNALFSREFTFRQRKSLSVGAKYTLAGGRRYGNVDVEASGKAQDVVFDDASRNTMQFRPYQRFDIKTEYKINRNRLTHTIAVDLVNVFGIENILGLSYTPEPPYYRTELQLGFLPIFFYRIDF